MDETNLQLFAIVVILAGGFVLVADIATLDWPDNYPGFWVVLLGFGISLVAVVRESIH